MSGALLQLVALGAQDAYLVGNKGITFFKRLYRRYVNFSTEHAQLTISGNADFGRRITSDVDRTGDLIADIYVHVTLPELTYGTATLRYAWTPEIGHRLIERVKIFIGGTMIDEQYGEWLSIWNELTIPQGKVDGYNRMIGNVPEITDFWMGDITTSPTSAGGTAQTRSSRLVYIPLKFWFNYENGLAIPLIALQYHVTKLEIEFATVADCVVELTAENAGAPTGASGLIRKPTVALNLNFVDSTIYTKYVYLAKEDRVRFAQSPHEYIITQVQRTEQTVSATNSKVKLNFNHPTKAMYIVGLNDTSSDANQWFNYRDRQLFVPFEDNATAPGELRGYSDGDGVNNLDSAELRLNNHTRFNLREGAYFNWINNYEAHSNIPKEGLNTYAFSLDVESFQPNGTANLSRIDNVEWTLSFLGFMTYDVTNEQYNPAATWSGTSKVYGINFNVLRILGGMGGLSYSS